MIAYFLLIFFTLLAANIKSGNPLRYIFFFVPTILIIGFRYEVGFDWPLYKLQFNHFKDLGLFEFFSQFPVFMMTYSHEPLFLFLSYFLSQILPEYEYMQVVVYCLFLYSTFRLGKALKVSNIIAAFIPIHFFLLFTLEFSAIRQIIAISFFNLGLAYFLKERKRVAMWLYGTAAFTQTSSLLYVVIQYFAMSMSKRLKLLIFFTGIVIVFLSVGGLQILLASILPESIGFKINFYLNERAYRASFINQISFIVLFVVIIVTLFKARKRMDKRILLISKVIIFLCVSAILMSWMPVVHNRLMYEMIVLISLLIYGPKFKYQKFLRYFLLITGMLFFTLYLRSGTSFTYIPYQNYIWFQLNDYESNGYERLDRLRQLIREIKE